MPQETFSAIEYNLLGYLPRELVLAGSCMRTPSDVAAPEADTSLTCQATPKISVRYERFPSIGAMDAHYESQVDANGVKRRSGDCATGEGESTWGFGKGGETGEHRAGRLACWQKGDRFWMMWTFDKLRIASTAVRSDRRPGALIHWWENRAGPFD